ncbi:hypothetical protein [Bradyrhizobium sp. 2S1]|uniref:hypothetical protein n=1 Tax=Bradyrhizobium sp. 2S1 TaxID=1404429 RepID=UPI00140C29E1|nr:hypothetical protein [Bradyrhizobium sp. 2S1]MCK7668315.1 hypothetical protein [Bradyrhizobium sp. 2S1]
MTKPGTRRSDPISKRAASQAGRLHFSNKINGLNMAGDAVLIAPVSKQDSLQTGNFAGKPAILAARRHDLWPKTAALQGLMA